MKRLIVLLLALLLVLPLFAQAQEVETAATDQPKESYVINLIENPNAEYTFAEGVTLLEVYFPEIFGADACIFRFGEETMLIDAATVGQAPIVMETMEKLGVDHLNIAFNTHPHDDHIMGFQQLPEDMPVDKFVIAFPEDENRPMRTTLKIIRERGIPIERVKNGSEMMLGDVRMVVMQKDFTSYTVNNRSAALMVFYGDRRLLMAADIETHAQGSLNKKPPEFGLKADILKYPHHGVAKAGWRFLENVDAELAIVTSKLVSIDETVADSEKRGLPLVSSVPGIVRLRTDGVIWVVDRITP
ncbi:MAG: hypothetical protein J6K73_03855 [Clostridia bacterium]|nr:hypothetical protein [Clostridia bacterium]MBP3648900.1 hypothetical protein [Clostridia bacterium]